ncbi:MAG: hypothetical protein J7L16_07420 [Deltaproteobacteria bacterium]|nr:hypothetical protein [Deltaproteobacteria bacterium]
MAGTLGIFVSSDKHLDKIIKLCNAAEKKQIDVTIFFTHKGVLLTQDSLFASLNGLAKMALCKVSFESNCLKSPVTGITEKDYATQAVHGEIIEECDRYIVL